MFSPVFLKVDIIDPTEVEVFVNLKKNFKFPLEFFSETALQHSKKLGVFSKQYLSQIQRLDLAV
jgi:hypothetical protein